MVSNFTYRQSQTATTVEVVVSILLAIGAWFAGYRAVALGLLIWAVLSLVAHFNRKYKDDVETGK